MAWEYLARTMSFGHSFLTAHGFDSNALTKVLNEFGAQDWELVSAFPVGEINGAATQLGLVFRRPHAVVAAPPIQTRPMGE